MLGQLLVAQAVIVGQKDGLPVVLFQKTEAPSQVRRQAVIARLRPQLARIGPEQWPYQLARLTAEAAAKALGDRAFDILILDLNLPDIDGLNSFGGAMFHSARWDYEYTGGSYQKPTLDKLAA